MSLAWGGNYIESHAITCPACKGHRYVGHLICLECSGDGQIVFTEQRKPGLFLTGWGFLKFFAGIVFFGLLGWLLMIGAFSL